jgi:hypothetical protein
MRLDTENFAEEPRGSLPIDWRIFYGTMSGLKFADTSATIANAAILTILKMEPMATTSVTGILEIEAGG